MQILHSSRMRAVEAAAFAAGHTADRLMAVAGAGIADVVMQFHPAPGLLRVFAGKGNNGGDALVAAKHLHNAGWRVELTTSAPAEALGPLCMRHFFEARAFSKIVSPDEGDRPGVILDGLLGLGFGGPLRPAIVPCVSAIRRLRECTQALVVAIDIPSGLDPDTGGPADGAVLADITATIFRPKSALFCDDATDVVGRIAVVPLPDLEPFYSIESDPEMSTMAMASELSPLLPRRNHSAHKGCFGRVGVVGGSVGFGGAAVLASIAALRGGAGLVTLYCAEDIYPMLAIAAPPEVMVRPVSSATQCLADKLDVLVVGPGLGRAHDTAILDLWRDFSGPAVFDADALNVLAQHPAELNTPGGPRLLTPHPGEMARLAPVSAGLPRIERAMNFVRTHPVTLLLKGARSIVVSPGRDISFNTTGGPAMAKGGQGDVLAGLCGALLAQGLPPHDAGRVAAWLCGRAAEYAQTQGGQSQLSLLPSDVIARFGDAWNGLRRGDF